MLFMDGLKKNVDQIAPADRLILERLLGTRLIAGQQVMIRVVDAADGRECATEEVPTALPPWCDVYQGLSDAEVSGIEEAILCRADLSRHSE
jgi:hypothetical protein